MMYVYTNIFLISILYFKLNGSLSLLTSTEYFFTNILTVKIKHKRNGLGNYWIVFEPQQNKTRQNL